ncbi:MAG TPA: NfeD family protein [Hyphomicrobiales bacterium]|nr:NfeD family protein [Hyphomicrobiales bacterium]
MAWLSANLVSLLIGGGLALLAIEVGVLGFSVFILFFIGLACLLTGVMMWLTLIPATLWAACVSIAILTLLLAVLLWTPLKRLQNSVKTTEVKGDLIGQHLILDTAVSPTTPGRQRYSGVEWQLHCDCALPAGAEVEIVKVEVGVLKVAPV